MTDVVTKCLGLCDSTKHGRVHTCFLLVAERIGFWRDPYLCINLCWCTYVDARKYVDIHFFSSRPPTPRRKQKRQKQRECNAIAFEPTSRTGGHSSYIHCMASKMLNQTPLENFCCCCHFVYELGTATQFNTITRLHMCLFRGNSMGMFTCLCMRKETHVGPMCNWPHHEEAPGRKTFDEKIYMTACRTILPDPSGTHE